MYFILFQYQISPFFTGFTESLISLPSTYSDYICNAMRSECHCGFCNHDDSVPFINQLNRSCQPSPCYGSKLILQRLQQNKDTGIKKDTKNIELEQRQMLEHDGWICSDHRLKENKLNIKYSSERLQTLKEHGHHKWQSNKEFSTAKDILMLHSKTHKKYEEPIPRFFPNRIPDDFQERLLEAIEKFAVRKEHVTTSCGFKTVTCITINRKTKKLL